MRAERVQRVRVVRVVLGRASVAHGGLGIVEMALRAWRTGSSRTGSGARGPHVAQADPEVVVEFWCMTYALRAPRHTLQVHVIHHPTASDEVPFRASTRPTVRPTVRGTRPTWAREGHAGSYCAHGACGA